VRIALALQETANSLEKRERVNTKLQQKEGKYKRKN
jgi:hypothetical protein